MPTKNELKAQLDEAKAEKDSLIEELARITRENEGLANRLDGALDELDAVQGEMDALKQAEPGRTSETIIDLENRLGRAQRELSEVNQKFEFTVMKVKEELRGEMLQLHSKELQARDYLVQLLREKVDRLEEDMSGNVELDGSPVFREGTVLCPTGGTDMSTVVSDTSSGAPGSRPELIQTATARGADEKSSEGRKRTAAEIPDSGSRPIKLPALATFNGEDTEDVGSFSRWLHKLERAAELYKWTDREKLIQFELLLTGRAEKIYELLSDSVKESFQTATEALHKRLTPVRREALVSAQLMRRRQQNTETVDQFAQDFEKLFDQSYGQRAGMDEESRSMLKRDLFVQGLLLKWQEKVLPSAETFTDALHQARVMEEQARQLAKLHPTGNRQQHPSTRSRGASEASSSSGEKNAPPDSTPTTTSKEATTNRPRCHRCNSPRHLWRDCPMRKPTTEAPGRSQSSTTGRILVPLVMWLPNSPATESVTKNIVRDYIVNGPRLNIQG